MTGQRSPSLHDVTFVVLDLETTGTSPDRSAITEIGAVKYRAGQRLGTLATLVDPGVPLPPVVIELTGLTAVMLPVAPRGESVLPSGIEFLRGGGVVGHNVGFDRAFLDAALVASGRAPLDHPLVDTLPLARRLLADEVPNHRLATLALHLRATHQPCHRALADALATADVLHALLERLGTWGVVELADLLAFPQEQRATA